MSTLATIAHPRTAAAGNIVHRGPRGERAAIRAAREYANATLAAGILRDSKRRHIVRMLGARELTFAEALAQLKALRTGGINALAKG